MDNLTWSAVKSKLLDPLRIALLIVGPQKTRKKGEKKNCYNKTN